MNRTPKTYRQILLSWLIITPVACAVGIGISALWHRFIQEATRPAHESHILPLIIVAISTASHISIAMKVKK
jgi:hypothetical protein